MTDWVDGHAVRFVKEAEAKSLYSAHRDEMSNETSGRAILARQAAERDQSGPDQAQTNRSRHVPGC